MISSLTDHARTRLQQRGIPEMILETLLDFGHEEFDHRGSAVIYLDQHSRKQLRRFLGEESYKRMSSHLDTYAVVARDGTVVTVGHRTRRINRH